jgi:hypothetical protein
LGIIDAASQANILSVSQPVESFAPEDDITALLSAIMYNKPKPIAYPQCFSIGEWVAQKNHQSIVEILRTIK